MRDLISRLFAKDPKVGVRPSGVRPSGVPPAVRSPEAAAGPGGQPARIHLVRDRDLEWRHRKQVASLVRDLRKIGFETITTFRIAELEDLRLVALAHPREGHLAVVYEHRLAGAWCNLAAVYENGETLTASNAPRGRRLEPIPGHERHLLRGASVAALYKSFRRQLRPRPRQRIEPANFVRVFEDAYAREIAWRAAPPAAGAASDPAASPTAVSPPVAAESPRAPSDRPPSAPAAAAPSAAADETARLAAARVAADRIAAERAAAVRDPELDRRSAPLHAAIAGRDRARVRELLGRGLPVEGRDAYGRTALMAAVASGDPQLVEALIGAGADVNARNAGLPGDALSSGSGGAGVITPLIAAIETGDAGIVTLLLASGADLAAPEELTPLQFAAQQGDAEVAAALLAAGAAVDQPGEDGTTPLLAAAAEGYADVVELLVMAGADVNLRAEGETAITLAAAAGAREVVAFLAPRVRPRWLRQAEKLLADAGPPRDTAAKRLMQAAMNGKAVMVGKLLGSGLHPDAVEHREEGETPVTPLMAATQEGHLEVMRLLIRAGADVNYPDAYGTPLKRALNPTFMDADRQPAVIRLLIESGADFEQLKDDERKLLAEALKGV